jgi:hypothetical protein
MPRHKTALVLDSLWLPPSTASNLGGSRPNQASSAGVERTVADLSTYANFWGGNSLRVVPPQLAERPYVNIAIYWGKWPDPADSTGIDAWLLTLKPDQAHQHGRLYVATRQAGAAVVTTDYMRLGPTGAPIGTPRFPLVRPIPQDVSEFKYGTWLSGADIEIAKKLGLPLGN